MDSKRPLLDPVFILRFWRETLDSNARTGWRVQVRNINTGRRDVVDDVRRAFTIVTAGLNAAEEEHEGSGERKARVSGDEFGG